MGKILILAKYIFLIYSADIYEKRRHNIYIAHTLIEDINHPVNFGEPIIEVDPNKKGDFSNKELNEIGKLIEENTDIINHQLNRFYRNKTVKAIRK